ncbi:MAG: T9SS type A sorting domain-containing protein [Bacteroidota bacterium]
MKHLNKTNPWLSRISQTWAFSLKATTLLLLMFCITTSKAQTNPCGCTPTSTVYSYTYNDPINCPNGYIDVEFTMVQCGSSIGILFNQAVGYNPLAAYPNNFYPCNFQADYKVAQDKILSMYGAGNNITFTYSAACNAVVEMNYGNITCYTFPLEGPQTGQAIPYNLGIVNQTVECTGVSCCTTEWIFNATTNQYHQAPNYPVVNCTNSSPVLLATYKMQCLDRNGVQQNVKGTPGRVIAPCYSFCDPVSAAVMLKTNINDKFQPIPEQTNITLAPIPATSAVTFSDTKNINKITVYDVEGKKVLEQNTFEGNSIDISQLKAGVHFVHVFFNNASLRTIKIIKE